MSFSRDRSSQPSPIQHTPALLARAPSAPVRWPSDFAASCATLQRSASQPMAPRLSRSCSTPDHASGSFRSLDAPRPTGVTSSAVATALHALETPSAEPSCHVVDAVMDYLDTLSAGGGAVYYGELEAVVEAMDLEG